MYRVTTSTVPIRLGQLAVKIQGKVFNFIRYLLMSVTKKADHTKWPTKTVN
jgi:hypothetical protein